MSIHIILFSLDKRAQNTMISKYRSPLLSLLLQRGFKIMPPPSHFSFAIGEGVQIITITNLHNIFHSNWRIECWNPLLPYYIQLLSELGGGYCGCKILNLSSYFYFTLYGINLIKTGLLKQFLYDRQYKI